MIPSLAGYKEISIDVRFNEVDSYEVVWHGNYVGYFEIGRLDLLKDFDLTPESLKEKGYLVPIVSLKCRYHRPARYGDKIVIRTSLEPTARPEFSFCYEVRRANDSVLLASGSSKQVLVNLKGNLIFSIPKWVKVKLEDIKNYLHETTNFRK